MKRRYVHREGGEPICITLNPRTLAKRVSESDTEAVLTEEAPGLLNELVPDHALAPGEPDLLDHVDFVKRLKAVIEQVSVAHSSANIALYGSWGSGKSGIANRLRERLAENERFIYVEIDAFKFGRKPLLRNFIRRIAEQVPGIDDVEEQMRPLYETTSRPHLRVPSLREIGWPLLFALQAAIALATFLIVCWVFGEGRPHQIAGRVLPSAALIGAIAALLAYFTTTRTTAPPEGDEQFEEIFRKMLANGPRIDGSSERRLVVFIDELDRCAPSEVASTLESLRTFLGVEGCIFIVAADQQVLEHALTHHLRQATPPDLANPYYSAGSAYLDKIFQYQLAFPPIRSRRLNHFALELLEGRGGVWAEEGIEAEDIVSILLPTHVQSPRRVKVLLNGFALTFGVAQARAERKNLPRLAPRARELAKLVCLKLEFPLFARELGSDHRLTAAVLLADRAARGDRAAAAELAELPRDLQARAELYAAGKLPVAQILSGAGEPAPGGEDSGEGDDGESDPQPDEEGEEEEGEDAEEESGEEGEEDAEALSAEEEASVQGRHAVQLVRYLEKTSNVAGPGSDLIHLESAGAVWGIDPQLAEELELDARDNRGDEVARRVAELEPEMRLNALLMLSRLAREEVGQDADNAIRSMLAAASELEEIPATVAEQLLGELEEFEERRALSTADLRGALDLAIAAGSEPRVSRYLERVERDFDHDLSMHVLGRAGALVEKHRLQMARVTARCLRTDGNGSFTALEELGEELASGLLVSAGPEVVRTIDSHFSRAGELEEADSASQAEGHRLVAEQSITELSNLAGLYLETEQSAMAELASLPLFGIDKAYEIESRFKCLAGLEHLETVELSAAALDLIDEFAMNQTLELLRALDPEVVAGIEAAPAAFDRLGAHIWMERVVGGREVEAELRAEVERLLSGGVEAEGQKAAETISEGLAERLESDADLESHEEDRSVALDIAELGLVSSETTNDGTIKALALSLREPAPADGREQMVSALRDLTDEFAAAAGAEELEEALRVLQEESWLAESELLPFEYLLLAALQSEGETEKPTLADLWEAMSEERAGQGTVGIWITHFAASPLDAFSAAEPFIEEPAAELLEGIGAYAKGLRPKQLADLSISAIEAHFDRWPAEEFFHVAEIQRADDRRLAEAIAALAPEATNPEQRRRLFDLWEWLSPTSGPARKRLIEAVLLPIAATGATGHELARQRLELVAKPPRGMKEEIVETLRHSAPDERRRQTLERRLVRVGLTKKGFFDRMLGR